jgi:hypothetical protein
MRNAALLAFVLICSARGHLRAQTFDPKADRPSILVLNGPWKFHTGDSPKLDNSPAPLWAESNFDDSGWQDYTIDPNHPGQTVVQAIQSDLLPGWQQVGHPGYTGYAWYRIRLKSLLLPDAREHMLDIDKLNETVQY